MSAEVLRLEVVTPQGWVVQAPTPHVVLPGALGEFGVLPGHIPLLSSLRAGVLSYESAGKKEAIAVQGGIAQVRAQNAVLVLTDAAAQATDVDVSEVRAELAAAQKQLEAWSGPLDTEHQTLATRVAWAEARLGLRALD